MSDLERLAPSLARNIIWSAIAQGWSLALSIISVLVLARLLLPEDFAVLAVVIPIIGLVQLVQALGINSAIIQSETVTKPQLNTLFWIVLSASFAMSVLLVLLAPAIARFANDPRLVEALRVVAVIPPIYALAGQAQGVLARSLHFRALAANQMLAFGLSILTSIFGAWLTGSYWALIAAQIVTPLSLAIGYITAARWRPGRPGPLAEVRTMLSFGLKVWGANLFMYVSRNADNLIVAAAATPRQLGLYDRSYRALLYPINQAVNPLGQVLIPTLTRCLGEAGRYCTHYWRAIAVLLLACQPALLVALVNPTVIVGALLGPEWLDAAPLFALFAGAGLFQTFQATLAWLLISQGRGSEYLRLNIVVSAIALASFLLGIGWGVEGLARAYVLGQILLCLPIGLWVTGCQGPIDCRGFVRGLMPHVIATLAAAALIVSLRYLLGSPKWPLLIATTLLSYGAYAGVLLALPQSRPLIASLLERSGKALIKAGRQLGGR
jgi:PST family polysaccharide transporter